MHASGSPGATGRRYILVVITALSALNQLDRQLINILIEPIRREFALNDIQIGFLAGFAFVIFYSALGIPAAIIAVRHSRKTLLATSAALWGAMTIFCGYAQSYTHLLIGRLGVGLGEAGGMPASHSIISDLYPPGQRAAAMSTWAAGINGGIFFAFLFGGLIGHAFGWRWALTSAGIVTLLFALLLQLTVREPLRIGSDKAAETSKSLLAQTITSMMRDGVIRNVLLGTTLASFVGSASIVWLPSFLVRSHGMGLPAVGVYLAITVGIGGAIGTWLGGAGSDRAYRRDMRWSLWLVAVVLLATKPFNFGFLLAHDKIHALAIFLVPAVLAGVYVGPSIAVLHDRVAVRLRPVASAVFLLIVNFVGFGAGPLAVGLMSDLLFRHYGPDPLRYSLVVMQAFGIWAALHYFRAGTLLGRERPEGVMRV